MNGYSSANSKSGTRGIKRIPLRLWCALTFAATTGFALSPSLSIRQYLHTKWTEMDGRPLPTAYYLYQSGDGYLWMSGHEQPLRFDGLRFTEGIKVEGRLRCVIPSAAGGLWVLREGDIRLVQSAGSKTYAVKLLGNEFHALEDGAGRLWVAYHGPGTWGVQALSSDGSIRRFGPEDGLPALAIETLARDGDHFWLGLNGAVCRWTPGATAACRSIPGRYVSLAVAGPDDVFAASESTVIHISPGREETIVPELSDVRILQGGLLADRNGNVWVGTTGGLLRVRGGRMERFTRKDGLSGDTVFGMAEDREGDLWVSTNAGIDRFRNPRVQHLSTLDGLAGDLTSCVYGARDGAVWVAASDNHLSRIDGTSIRIMTVPRELPLKEIYALYEDARGGMWMGGPWGLARYFGGRFTNIPARDGSRIGPVMGLSGDADGAVWAAAERSGVWRAQDGRADPVEGMAWRDIVRVVWSREGVPWFGAYESGAIQLAGGRPQVFGAESGIRGPLRGLFEDGAGNIWVGAGNTLTRFRHGRRTTWGTREGMPEGQIFGITESRGSLWIVTASAVLRLDAAELERAGDGAPQPLRITQYDARDGFHSNPAGMPSPRITTARDGRVWAVERDGVAIFDPDLLEPDTAPPPVAIEQLIADGKPVEGSAPAFRARQLRIVYTGLSLMAPERVRFRYRLEPLDPGWTDAGTERQVTLANPGPGSYRFRVAAANLDGVWNESGAAIEFRIVPYYYQTWWFDVLLMLAAYGVGWVVYRFHMERVKERFQLVAQERARLTREIHDSLLQGFVGVVFQLHAASRQFGSNPEASKKKLDEALQLADHSIKEARQLLLDMRLPALEDQTLPEALAEVGVEATKETRIDFQIETTGVVTPLPYAAQAAIFLIGREAIHNAARHAEPGHIWAQLSYAEKEVRLVVEDDGTGFDPKLARRKEGHFGLWSMRERARNAGGECEIDAEPGRGSRIEVAMPRNRLVE